MPTQTYTPLATVTLGSSASTVTFSSIPATYRDLVLIIAGTYVTSQGLNLRMNSDTSNVSTVRMYNTTSDTPSVFEVAWGGAPLTSVTQIMDYSATDKHKTTLCRWGTTGTGGATDYTLAIASRWASTAAINTLTLVPTSGTIPAGMSFSLYGIAA